MRKSLPSIALVAFVLGLVATSQANAQVNLLAVGSLTSSRAGSFADLSGLHETLENGAPANLLGGLGSGIAYASGNTFLALPDRGPNAVPFDSLIDDTVSYIPRFHTITMDLKPNTGTGLPFTLTPKLRDTTLLWSLTPLVYGTGENLAVGSGVPPQNNFFQHFFSGRSDNFDPNQQLRRPQRRPPRFRRHPSLQRRPQRLYLRRVRPVRLRVRPPLRRAPALPSNFPHTCSSANLEFDGRS